MDFLKNQEAHPQYDLIIIGGGINGAAAARDASMRGLSVALFEKYDFGYGASSRTSKLAHGGLRYLEHLDFYLVRESLYERNLLLKNAPQLVSELPFIFPVYKNDKRPLWLIKLGVWLYDFINLDANNQKHQSLKAAQIINFFPDLKSSGLKGGSLYFDAQMSDSRIVIENIISANVHGAQTYNYSPVKKLLFKNNRVSGVQLESGKEVLAHTVINATGAWSKDILATDAFPAPYKIQPTKGVHLVIPQIHPSHALILSTPQDNRIFFLIPWEDYSLLGTTDTHYQGRPENVCVEEEDIDYLLEAYEEYFPKKPLKKSAIISSFAGLRPLATLNTNKAPSEISRKHHISQSASGLMSIIGGKYTNHRKVAEELINTVIKNFSQKRTLKTCSTAKTPLIDLVSTYTYKDKDLPLKKQDIERLKDRYGHHVAYIFQIIIKDPEQAQSICKHTPHLYAELTYSIEKEHTRKLEDWFMRRTSIGNSKCAGKDCLENVTKHFAKYLAWNENDQKKEMNDYKKTFLR